MGDEKEQYHNICGCMYVCVSVEDVEWFEKDEGGEENQLVTDYSMRGDSGIKEC